MLLSIPDAVQPFHSFSSPMVWLISHRVLPPAAQVNLLFSQLSPVVRLQGESHPVSPCRKACLQTQLEELPVDREAWREQVQRERPIWRGLFCGRGSTE